MKTTCSPNSDTLGNATRRLACLGLAVAMLAGWTVSAATLYVWPDSPNPVPPYDSWANAATNIQDAVDAAQSGDLVLVTNGVYATGGRAVDGTMTNRVVIDKAITVQSINGPEVTVIEGAPAPGGGNGDGAIRCVYLGINSVLSGFTLTNGFAGLSSGLDAEDSGGGAWCVGPATLTNCIVTGNHATDKGGGVYGGLLYNCTLTGNSAYSGGGACGGTLHNCTLSGNSAEFGGGFSTIVIGFFNPFPHVVETGELYNCTVTGNSASNYGGGEYGGAKLYNCTVMSNFATHGGGGDGGTFYNCTLTRNLASDFGGGVYNCFLYNCIVYSNSAPKDPNYLTSIFNYSCTTPQPSDGTNNISVDPQMATLTHLSASSPCIAAGNSAYASGLDMDGEPWADPPCMGADQLTPGQATGALSMTIEAPYTNVAPGFAARFVAHNEGTILASVWDFDDGTTVSNQSITSHAWNAPGRYTVRLTGYNDSFPDGTSATLQVEVTEGVYYVSQANSTPVFPYASWATAATNIQDAIEAGTTAGRLVLVTNGVYASGAVEAQGTNRIALTSPVMVQSVNGPGATVIKGAAGVRCAYLGADASLSGFSLTRGEADYGGGARCEYSATLTNCAVTGNSASVQGGGAYGGILYNCTLTGNSTGLNADGGGVCGGRLYNCILTANSATDGGGTSWSTLYNCFLTGNSAGGGGGTSWSTLYDCTLTGNSAGVGGGAYGGTLYNCTLTGNSAAQAGGGYGGGESYDALYNCTLTGNSASQVGGGVYGGTFYNCIVYFNSAPEGPNYYNGVNNRFEYSCTTPGLAGAGNISANPEFVDAANGDFHLRYGSPCIDAGTNLSDIVTNDFDGTPRPLDGNYDGLAQFDMGAYEFNPYGPEPTPKQIGAYNTGGYATDVAVMGNYAYVADGEAGLQVIDISNSNSPVRVGGFDTPGYAVGVAVSSNYAYLADGYAGLQIIDISNPANPQRVGGYDTSGSATDVSLAGNYAYVADGEAGLQIIDVSNPANPQRVGGYQTSGSVNGVMVSGNYAYVADGQAPSDGGLEVVDIGNPAAPAQVGVIDSLGYAHNVALAGNDAYVATGYGLQVIDVSNPAAPVRVGNYDTAGEISDVAVEGPYAYVVAPDIGLHVLDISNPQDPVRYSANASFSASGVTADGDNIYVAAGEEGLIVLNQAPEIRFPGIVASDGLIRLSLKGTSGQCVCVQRSTDLVRWEDWKTVTLGADGFNLTDTMMSGKQCFYRVVKAEMQTKN